MTRKTKFKLGLLVLTQQHFYKEFKKQLLLLKSCKALSKIAEKYLNFFITALSCPNGPITRIRVPKYGL